MALIKLNNKAVSNATAFGSISSLGSMVFIKKLTASSSATLSFVHGTDGVVLDDTYKEYVFTFKNMHPATDNVQFDFNVSTDGGSNYNVAKTSTAFRAYAYENGAGGDVGYRTDLDLAQGTGFQNTIFSLGNGADESCAGSLQIFNPSSDTFVKHYISTLQGLSYADLTVSCFVGGYANTTSAVNAVRFQMSSGNIDAGDICLYGIA